MIPRIGVKASFEYTTLHGAWDWDIPHTWWTTAWYDRGPKPGEPGHALVFGHLDSTCCPALFWNLHDLQPGDIVRVAYRSGHPVEFRVVWSQVYWNDRSVDWVYKRARDRSMLLITCTGIFYPGRGYDRRLIVYTRLVG